MLQTAKAIHLIEFFCSSSSNNKKRIKCDMKVVKAVTENRKQGGEEMELLDKGRCGPRKSELDLERQFFPLLELRETNFCSDSKK